MSQPAQTRIHARRAISHDAVSDLIGDVYDAATSPAGWTPALQKLGHIFRAPSAVIVATDRTTAVVEQHTNGAADEYIAAYERGPAYDHSIWRPDAPIDEPLDESWFFPNGDFLKSSLYRDFLQALPTRRFALVYSRVQEQRHTYLALVRPDEHDEFDADQKGALRLLAPHIRRAFGTFTRLVAANERFALTSAALERVTLGVVVMRADGNIVHANAAARTVIARGGILLQGRGAGIVAARHGDAQRLRALLAEALGGQRTSRGGTMTIDREHHSPLVVTVMPLRSDEAGFAAGGALVLLADRESTSATRPAFLRECLGLTDAEARVACALLDGASVKVVAARLSISKETARTHLKRIFTKTGATRQADLLLLLQRYAALDPTRHP